MYLIFVSPAEYSTLEKRTIQLLRDFYQYKYNISRQQNAQNPVIKHLLKHGWIALRVLESNPRWSSAQCKRAERKRIRLLDTILPHGLNDKWLSLTSCSFFYPHIHLNHQHNIRCCIHQYGMTVRIFHSLVCKNDFIMISQALEKNVATSDPNAGRTLTLTLT